MVKRVTMWLVFSKDERWQGIFEKNVWFYNKIHFLLNCNINFKNCVFWGSKNLHSVVGCPQHPKITWLGFPSRSVSPLDYFSFKMTRVTSQQCLSCSDESTSRVRTLMKKNRGSNEGFHLLSLLMLPWHGSAKCWMRRVTSLPWPERPRFLPLGNAQVIYLSGQLLQYCSTEGYHHWKDLNNLPGGIFTSYQQFCTPYWRIHSTYC